MPTILKLKIQKKERERKWKWEWMNMNISLVKDLDKHKYFLLQLCNRVFEYLALMKNVLIVLKKNLKMKNSPLY